jgi:hypothetical protein
MENKVPNKVNDLKVKKEHVSCAEFLQMRIYAQRDSVHGDSERAKWN